jgi:ribosomal protein L11 methyltransferase
MFELQLLCPEATVEIISDALLELDAVSISVEDADADTANECALFGEPGAEIEHAAWVHSKVLALFATEEEAKNAATVICLQDFFEASRVLAVTPLVDQDWVRLTQSQFSPVAITPDFFIVPTWSDPPPQARHTIRLDPGLAFGTGTHPTTHMCLQWIAAGAPHNQPLGRTLDYGCGSGILAIAAKQWGATFVDAVDIDPSAVSACEANARANLDPSIFNQHIRIGLPDLAEGVYNTVLANILASPLKVLAPLLTNYLAPNGRLVLAGILERQADELRQAYAPYLRLDVSHTKEGWILMTGCLV